MIRGLALAETTPGPLIMVVQFVAFVAAYRDPGALDPWLAAVIAALLTTWVTFVPCFVFVFVGAPYVERLRGNHALSSALTGITAAVVGVIANLAVYFALHPFCRDSHQDVGSRRAGDSRSSPPSTPWPWGSPWSRGADLGSRMVRAPHPRGVCTARRGGGPGRSADPGSEVSTKGMTTEYAGRICQVCRSVQWAFCTCSTGIYISGSSS